MRDEKKITLSIAILRLYLEDYGVSEDIEECGKDIIFFLEWLDIIGEWLDKREKKTKEKELEKLKELEEVLGKMKTKIGGGPSLISSNRPYLPGGSYNPSSESDQKIREKAITDDLTDDAVRGIQVITDMARAQEEEFRDKIEERKPIVSIQDSVQPDYLICLEDGKRVKMLKRYLKTNFNMTFDEYKMKWKLPDDYPAACPALRQKRQDIAKKGGLGKRK